MNSEHREALQMAFSARDSFQQISDAAPKSIGERLTAIVAVWIGSHKVPGDQRATDDLQRSAMCDLVCQVWTLVENGEDRSPDQQATEEA